MKGQSSSKENRVSARAANVQSMPSGPAAHGDTAQGGEILPVNVPLRSANGLYSFVFQADGNLVLYKDYPAHPSALWNSRTNGQPVAVCIMQTDGNLVLYDPDGKAVWNAGTYGHAGSRLVVQDDGNVVIYQPNNVAIWATNTVQTPVPIDKSAGNYILPSRTVDALAKQGKAKAGVILRTGVDIVTGVGFGSPFAGPLKLVKTGFTTTNPRVSCEIVSSSDTYRKSLEFAASAGVNSSTISVQADVSWVSTQEVSATSLAVVAQAYKDGEEFLPDLTQAVAIDLSKFTSYSDFVAHYGTHFIGGYRTGASYTAIYKMECHTYSEAYALSAALDAQGSWGFDANLTTKVSNAVSSSHTEAKTSWDHAAEHWPDNAPPIKSATPDGIGANLETFNTLKSDQLTGPLYYVAYELTGCKFWRSL